MTTPAQRPALCACWPDRSRSRRGTCRAARNSARAPRACGAPWNGRASCDRFTRSRDVRQHSAPFATPHSPRRGRTSPPMSQQPNSFLSPGRIRRRRAHRPRLASRARRAALRDQAPPAARLICRERRRRPIFGRANSRRCACWPECRSACRFPSCGRAASRQTRSHASRRAASSRSGRSASIATRSRPPSRSPY